MDDVTKNFLKRIAEHLIEVDEHIRSGAMSSDSLRRNIDKIKEDIWHQETTT